MFPFVHLSWKVWSMVAMLLASVLSVAVPVVCYRLGRNEPVRYLDL